MAEVRNTIELNIYNEENEVVKTYESYGLRWKAFKSVMARQKELEKINTDNPDAMDVFYEIIKLAFPSLTDEEFDELYIDDIFNTFKQILAVADNMAKNL